MWIMTCTWHTRQFKTALCFAIPLLLSYRVKAEGNPLGNPTTIDYGIRNYRSIRLTTPTYSDELSTLENIPKIPDGHRHFQFYALDPNGNLQKQWMSLQEVQHIILAHAYQNHPKHKESLYKRPPYVANAAVQKNDGFFQKLAWKSPEKRPETSIEDVLANVQKVMSKEITKTYLKGDFPTTPTLPEVEHVTVTTFSDVEGVTAQNITIPDTILGHLMRDQVASLESHNPWGILTTPGVGGKFNTVLKRIRDKFRERTTIPPSEENSLNEENFVEGNDVKTTLTINSYAETTENSFFNDTDSLMRFNPEIFDSTTEVSEDGDSSFNAFETATETINFSAKGNRDSTTYGENITTLNSENQIYITTEMPIYENEYKIFKNQNNANIDDIKPITNPGETWATSSVIYTKDKPSYTVIPVKDLANPKQSEDLSFVYKNEFEKNAYQTTTRVNEEEVLFELVTTLSYPPITEYVQATDSMIQNYSTTPPFVNNLTKLLNSGEESINEISTQKTHNQKLREKHFENSKFSTNEENVNKFKDDLGGETVITYLNNDRHVSSSSVLTPSEIAKGSAGQVGTVGILQNKQDYNFSYYDTAIYLEDIPEVDYDFDDTPGIPKPNKIVNTSKITFPSPNVTDSYHKPDHISHSIGSKGQPIIANKDASSSFDPDDPLQFLPAHNPAIAQRENPLQTTPVGNIGLEETIAELDPNIREYVNSMNDISFQVYKKAAEVHRRQNMVMAPINLISALSMLLLAARDKTSDALSKLLKFDELLTFNPHLILKNVTESFIALNSLKHEAAIVNNIFVEKSNKKSLSLDFFDQTMEFFYGTKIKEVPVHTIGPKARDQANELIRAQTLGVVHNFLKPNASLKVVGPLSVVSSAYFQGDWGIGINEKDLIDMSFIRFPSAERRLIKTVGVLRRMDINAGYSQELDATIAEVPLHGASKEVSLILVMPGQQKSFVANGLSQLEQSLTSEAWSKLIRSVLPHTINFKMPIFSHRNYLNLSGILSIMGLKELFSTSSDFSGINGLKNLHLGDVVQLSEFHSCKLEMGPFAPTDGRSQDKAASQWSTKRSGKSPKEEEINVDNDSEKRRKNYLKKAADYIKKHQVEERKHGRNISSKRSKSLRRRRQNDRISNFYHNDNTLAYDRAFFYVLRHNPTGLILFIGRYLDPEVF